MHDELQDGLSRSCFLAPHSGAGDLRVTQALYCGQRHSQVRGYTPETKELVWVHERAHVTANVLSETHAGTITGYVSAICSP